ncbi:MAG: TetR/AcrR family transcriptional regulator [Polyangiaceae bacterium]
MKSFRSGARSGIYRGQSGAERRAERRERLMAGAIERFGTVGYAATPIDDICAVSGVTARHFYEQFPGREALLREVYDAIIADTQRAVVRALSSAAVAEDRVAAGVRAFVHAYLDDPRRGRIAAVEVIGVSEDMERHRRSVIHAFASLIQAQAELLASEGKIERKWNYELVGIALAGGVNELIADWIFRRDKPRIPDFAAEIVVFFLAVVQAGSARRPSLRRAR